MSHRKEVNDDGGITGLVGHHAKNVGSLGVIGGVVVGFLILVTVVVWMLREAILEDRAIRRQSIEHGDKSVLILRDAIELIGRNNTAEIRNQTERNAEAYRRLWESHQELINLQRTAQGLPPKKVMAWEVPN